MKHFYFLFSVVKATMTFRCVRGGLTFDKQRNYSNFSNHKNRVTFVFLLTTELHHFVTLSKNNNKTDIRLTVLQSEDLSNFHNFD